MTCNSHPAQEGQDDYAGNKDGIGFIGRSFRSISDRFHYKENPPERIGLSGEFWFTQVKIFPVTDQVLYMPPVFQAPER